MRSSARCCWPSARILRSRTFASATADMTGSSREASSIVKIPPTGIPLEEVERLTIVEALKMSNWVQKDAAELLVDQPARDELQDQDARHRLPARPPRAGGAARTCQRRDGLRRTIRRPAPRGRPSHPPA